MKLTISGKTYVNDKTKDGKPLETKDGRPYKKISFKVKEEVLGTVGKYINGFYRDEMEHWDDGTEIEVEVVQNGEYLNFELPKKVVSRAEFDLLLNRVKVLEDRVLTDTQEDIPIYEEEG